MQIKRFVIITALALIVAALVMSLAGLETRVAAVANSKAPLTAPVAAPVAPPPQHGTRLANGQQLLPVSGSDETAGAAISPQVRKALGLSRITNVKSASQKIAQRILSGRQASGSFRPQAGQPEVLAGNSAFSAAVVTTIGGRDNQFSEVALLADWDGREDDVADRSKKVDDFSGVEPEIDFSLTRAAISEHTIANGFAENIFYYGDSVGNVWVGADTTGDGRVDTLTQINLPTVLNAFGTINS